MEVVFEELFDELLGVKAIELRRASSGHAPRVNTNPRRRTEVSRSTLRNEGIPQVTEPSVLIVSVNANFNGYTCGGWADWDDDWGFAGIGYRVSIWWSKDWEETSPVERIGGTIVMLGDDPIWGGTHYNPLLDLASNGRTPATPIPDLATTFNVGTWGSPMLMSPGNVVHVQFDWIMYVQINGDSAKANLYTGEHGGADLGITVDLETP